MSAETLGEFNAEIQGLDAWKEFEEVLGNTSSSMDECKEVANKLATEYVNSANFLSHLTEENKDYYVSQLSEMGISNALKIVNSSLLSSENAMAVAKSEVAEYANTLTDAFVYSYLTATLLLLKTRIDFAVYPYFSVHNLLSIITRTI